MKESEMVNESILKSIITKCHAAKHYKEPFHLIATKTGEELSEAATEVFHLAKGKDDTNMLEELADVFIMIHRYVISSEQEEIFNEMLQIKMLKLDKHILRLAKDCNGKINKNGNGGSD